MTKSLNHIHPNAKIASNVTINPFTTVCQDVEIGENTWIGPNVTIMDGARIGANCKVFPGAVISAVPQDLKFKGEESLAIIGDHTVIRECVTINRGTSATGKTEIGSHCLLMAYSHIAHDCVVGNHCIFSNSSTLAGHVNVGNHVVLAGLTAIQQFCRIGDFAFISGGSRVRKDVPPYVKVARDPLIFVGVNSIGMERNGVEKEQISLVQEVYRTLFRSKHNISQALDVVKNKIEPTKERYAILEFIEKSSQGIVRGYHQKS
jgi:UDP-N-acetylglucosamine acyltransferase